jgi:pilus assembly protein TadC
LRSWIAVAFLALIIVVPAVALAGQSPPAVANGITITPTNPLPGSQTANRTPTITAKFSDSGGTVNPGSVVLLINKLNCTNFQGFSATTTSVSCALPTILALRNGIQNVTVNASDSNGHFTSISWNFTINPNATGTGAPVFSVSAQTILLYLGIAAGIAGAVFFGYILYLRQTTRFAFRKYFATHPIQRSYLVLYIPCILAFVFLLIGLDYVTGTPGLPAYSLDLVFIIAIFIAFLAFGIDARYQLARLRLYERAFAQFLFEMADAMRGGLDPAKAIIEIAKTQTNILARPLRIAADGIRIGRPFEVVLEDMARPIRSALISRYAALISEATSVGGDTATVIYRAAKDMDDFVKIEQERANQLTLPVAVIYISFAVLMAVLFALLYIAPSLGTLNIGFLSPGSNALKGGTSPNIARLSISELHERFFELTIINSLGTGAIIGAFTEGRMRYGILHGLALVAASTVLFLFIFP